jgi:hypothetical protein
VGVKAREALSEAVVQEHSKQVPKKLDDGKVSEADMKLYSVSHFFNTPTKCTLYILTHILPDLSYMFWRDRKVINIPELKKWKTSQCF